MLLEVRTEQLLQSIHSIVEVSVYVLFYLCMLAMISTSICYCEHKIKMRVLHLKLVRFG